MKIYSRKDFIFGLIWLSLAVLRIARLMDDWRAAGLVVVALDVVLSALHFYHAFKRSWEKESAVEREWAASRRLFGPWRYLVESFGAIVIVLALLWVLWSPNQAGISIILIIAGFLYTFFIGDYIRKHTDIQ